MVRATRLSAIAARFLRAEAGVTSIEYAVLGSVLAVAIILGAQALGTQLDVAYTAVAAAFGA